MESDEQGKGGAIAKTIAALTVVIIVLNLSLAAVALIVKTRMRSWGDEDSDSVELVTIMDGLEFNGRAKEFAGGSVFTMMGSSELDLRRVQLSPHGAFLQVRTIMGATEIVVPEHWRVMLEGTAIAGVNEKSVNAPDLDAGAPTLELDARTYMGALEITHAPMPITQGSA